MDIQNTFRVYNFLNASEKEATKPAFFFKGKGNLAPLDRDTVSFSGRGNKASKESTGTAYEIRSTKSFSDTNEPEETEKTSKATQDDKSFSKENRSNLRLANSIYADAEYSYDLMRYMQMQNTHTT